MRLVHWKSLWELPPRARRIHALDTFLNQGVGTTSACAENTAVQPAKLSARRNYLRVRGEYMMKVWAIGDAVELPPRARRILTWGWGACIL